MEMPVTFMLAIVVGLIVLIALVLMFLGIWSPFPGSVNAETAKQKGCRDMMIQDPPCSNPNINVTFDVNGNGKVGDTGDTLMLLCETQYGCSPGNATCCKEVCGCE